MIKHINQPSMNQQDQSAINQQFISILKIKCMIHQINKQNHESAVSISKFISCSWMIQPSDESAA
jgi:hypothetical protein